MHRLLKPDEVHQLKVNALVFDSASLLSFYHLLLLCAYLKNNRILIIINLNFIIIFLTLTTLLI